MTPVGTELLIVNGRVFDGTEAPARPAAVHVRDGRIAGVGPRERFHPAPGTPTLDAAGGTVLPGLIDCHVHLTSHAGPDHEMRRLKELVPLQALRGAANAAAMLRAGFTTVRDLGAAGYANIAIAQAIEEGLCPGPRVLAAGASLTVTGGHGDSYYRPGVSVPREGMVAGPVAAREAVRQMVRMRADVIKLLVTGGVMTDGSDVGALQWTQEELQAAIEQAHQLGRRVAGHCHGAAGVVAAVRVGLDTVEHGTMLDEEAIGLMAERGTFLVPTLVAGQTIVEHGTAAGIAAHVVRKAVQVVEWHRKSVSRAREAGVRVAFGTDCGTPFNRAGRNGTELALMVACGFSPAEALRAATSMAAQALGLAEEIGTVEPGKAADLLVVAGDPLADVGLLADGSHVAWVVKAGRVVRRPDLAGGPGDD